jgi:hypothetical protein
MKRVFVIAFILVSCFNKSVAQVESFFSNDSVVTKIDIPLQGATMPSKGGTIVVTEVMVEQRA